MASATKVISITAFPQALPERLAHSQLPKFEPLTCDICGFLRQIRQIGGVRVCMVEVSEAEWAAATPDTPLAPTDSVIVS